MRSATLIYRYLTAVFTADVLLRFFLAGAGVFSASGGTAAVTEPAASRSGRA
jgi:hypothetical protein